MENGSNTNEKIKNIDENKFEIEYFGQDLKKNESFINWQNEMKIFKCKKDKILYYGRFNDCKKIPLYKIKCPICNLSHFYLYSKHLDDYVDHGKSV